MQPILNISAYRFVPLHDLPALRTRLRDAAAALALKGTVLLAEEGINLFLAGAPERYGEYLAEIHRRDEAVRDVAIDLLEPGGARLRCVEGVGEARTRAMDGSRIMYAGPRSVPNRPRTRVARDTVSLGLAVDVTTAS